jgi:hypothetical protein|tara:strand:- start:694 stop:885 length:192 start_codon:yes stop_codon:yes gene_type:complete
LAVLRLGIWFISQVGLVWAGPAVAIALMVLMGECRRLWLLMGGAATPAVIWLLVDVLLDRNLP